MEAMLFQVAERSLRFCRLFETKNVNGKIRFFRVRPGRILTIARIVKGRRQAKFNVLFSSSLHSRVHQCPLRMLRASVVRACPSRVLSLKAEKKTGACSQFSEAYPIFCKDSQSRVSHQIIRTLAAGSARTGSSRSKLARTGDSFEYIGGSVFRLPPSDFPVNIVKICRSRSRSALLSCELTIS